MLRPEGVAALVALLLAASTGSAVAATYWVDPSHPAASPSGPGTETQPYSTITSAVAARAAPGNTILVRPGVYREEIIVPASGAPGAPFVLRAAGPGVLLEGAEDFSSTALWAQNVGDVYLAASVNWSPNSVLVDGVRLEASSKPISSMPANSFRYVTGQGLYVNLGSAHPGLQDTRVGRRDSAFELAGKSWVVIEGFHAERQDDRAFNLSAGSSDVEILGNTIRNANKYGIYLNGCQRVRIAGNTVSDNANHGIMLTLGTSECTIEDNESFGNAVPNSRAANGLYLFGASRCVIRRNRWHDNQDTGQHLQSNANDNVSYNNRSWNNGDHGYDHLGALGTLHLNDVAYGNYKDGFSIEGGATGTRLFNCISVDNGLTTNSSDLWVEYTSLAGFESNDNLFWNSTAHAPIRYDTGIYATIAAYSAVSGQDTRSLQQDPMFVSPMTGNFHVFAGSPVIDRANASHADFPISDSEGSPRVDDPATPNAGFGVLDHADLGPLEYQPAGLAPRAELAADPGSGAAPLFVTLDASASSDPDGFIIEYFFDFGDGVSAGPQFGPVTTHTYTAGTHRAVVTVTDDFGLSHSDTVTVVVVRSPVASLTASPLSGRAPLLVSLDASASSGGEGPVVSYRFDLGDGTVIGPQASPLASHAFGTGAWWARLTVTDAHGTADTLSAPIPIHVASPNVPPTASLALSPRAGRTPLEVVADASGSMDSDGGIVSYRFTFDDTTVVGPQPGATTRRILGEGLHVVQVLVSDADGGTATAVDTVRVDPDPPPVVTAPATAAVAEAGVLTLTVTASDPDGEPVTSLTADLSALPPGNDAVFAVAPDFASGTLTWHPTYADSGRFEVVFTAGNAALGSATCEVRVDNVDRAPQVTLGAAAYELAEDSVFVMLVSVSDPDGDAVTGLVADASPAPPGGGPALVLAPGGTEGTFEWRPGFADSGSYTVTVTATNALPGAASADFHVRNTDRAPEISAPLLVPSLNGEPVAFTVTAADPDGDAIETLTADLSALLGDGEAAFVAAPDRSSGSFTWAPGPGSSGPHPVTFTAGNALARSHVTVVDVREQDLAPVVVVDPAAEAAEGEPFTLAVSVTEPDGDPIASLTADLSGLPAGHTAVFTPDAGQNAGTLAWTPGYTDSGTYLVRFLAANTLADTAEVVLHVRGTDRTPVVTAVSAVSVAEGAPLALEVSASDADGDPVLSLEADLSGLPAGHTAVFTSGAEPGTATLTWTPGFAHAGTWPVRFVAANALADTCTTLVTVLDTDRPPVVTAPAAVSFTAMIACTLRVAVSDADGDAIVSLEADLSQLPAGHSAVFTPAPGNAGGELVWTPTVADTGSRVVSFTASNAAVAQAVTLLTVGPPNQPPLAALAASPVTGNAPLLVSLDGSASSDPDGAIVSYRFEFGDGVVAGPQASPLMSHEYGPGSWTARVTVTDAFGAEDQATVQLLVAAPGPGPNLVANASFETALTGWNAASGATLARAGGGFDGAWAAQASGPAAGLSSFGINDSPNWVLDAGAAGTRYRFSAWVRSDAATGEAKLQVREYLGLTKIGATLFSVPVPLSPLWQLVTVEHVTQTAGTTLDFHVLDYPATAGETFLVDNVSAHVVPAAAPPAAARPSGTPGPADTGALEFGARVVPTVAQGGATLHFTTTRRGAVRADLFDTGGRLVRRLVDDPDMAPGLHSLNFDARGDRGDRLGPGVYFYRVQAAERSAAGRLVLVR